MDELLTFIGPWGEAEDYKAVGQVPQRVKKRPKSDISFTTKEHWAHLKDREEGFLFLLSIEGHVM